MKVTLDNLLPSTGKLNRIYRGVVEDNKDPEKRGRVRVRIFGIHTQERQQHETMGIPTEHLSWAEPVCSIMEGSISGYGVWAVPVQGSHVFLFFENGNILQPRYFATSPGVPKTKPDPNKGFSDPDNEYPIDELLGEADWHKLARDVTDGTIIDTKKNNLLEDIPKADGEYWDEPEYLPEDKYPNNIVIATHGGHVIEIDNTEGGERLHYYHPSHSYLEFNQDGDLIIRNAQDRYDISMQDYNSYVENDRNITVGGKSSRLVSDDEKVIVNAGQDVFIRDDQKIYVKGSQTLAAEGENSQNFLCTGLQNIASWVNQKLDCKGNRTDSCYGNETKSNKGWLTNNVLGWFDENVGGFYTRQVKAIKVENSWGMNFIGSPVKTHLGFTPTGTALNVVNSAVGGIMGAIREQMQPIFDTVNALQKTIDSVITDAVNFVNSVVTPVTDIVNDINNVVDYVKQEYNYARQLVQTVQNLPYTVVRALVNHINSITSIPGTIIYTTIGKLNSSVRNLNLLKAVNRLYSSANDFGFQLKPNLLDLNQYMSDITKYTQFDLNILGRSGLASYDGTTYNTRDYLDYYGNTSSVTTSGSMADELEEMQQFVSDALSASFISSEGDFLVENALNSIFDQQSDYIENTLLSFSINDLLNPSGMTLPEVSGSIIDNDTLNEACSGYFVDSMITIELSASQLDLTVDEVLADSGISLDARNILENTKYIRIPSYSGSVSYIIREQIKEVFNKLIDLENDIKDITSNIDYDKITWNGKFDDWEHTWPPSGSP